VDEEATAAGFEWDSINDNPDIDVWVVRIPTGVRPNSSRCLPIIHLTGTQLDPSDLAGLKIKLPSTGADDVTGTLKKSGFNFTLRTVGGEGTFGAGEEMQSMQCILPKESEDGTLYIGKYLNTFSSLFTDQLNCLQYPDQSNASF
jgi:hypothetical protein